MATRRPCRGARAGVGPQRDQLCDFTGADQCGRIGPLDALVQPANDTQASGLSQALELGERVIERPLRGPAFDFDAYQERSLLRQFNIQ